MSTSLLSNVRTWTPAVPRLIHLNGPPGIGKSTLAQMYVDKHPGVLNLDVDLIRGLIGGWRDRFAETGEIVERNGGPALLADMHDRLIDMVRARPNAVVVPSVAEAVHRTYEALIAVLEQGA